MLNRLLKYLYPDSNPPVDWHTANGRIMHWALDEPQPTESEIEKGLKDVAFLAWAKAEQCAEIDKRTGRKINRSVHPLCGTDETLSILRDQMVQWGNKLGLEFTPDMVRLNDIAILAVEEGAVEKAAITDA